MNLSHWREDYNRYNLKEKDLLDSPFSMFEAWFKQAVEDQNPEPNAMVVGTSSGDEPQVRYVLLKELKAEQFVFYTSYTSAKGKQLEANPRIQLLFFWPLSQRQIRISGIARKIERKESIVYFDTRPLESRISAIASPQSQRIEIEELLQRVEKVENQNEKPCPEHWGGYAVSPNYFEFWQGQSGRLHDRLIYKKIEGDKWEIFRLAP